jgi:hypothetical protein
MKNCFINPLTTLISKFLDVRVCQICVPITPTNSNLVHYSVSSWVTVYFTRDINVSMSPLGEFIYPVTLSLKKLFFLFKLGYPPFKLFSSPIIPWASITHTSKHDLWPTFFYSK